MVKKKEITTSSYCSDCEKNTIHFVLAKYEQRKTIAGDEHHRREKQEYFIVKCRGCTNVSFLLALKGHESSATKMNKPYETRMTFPKGPSVEIDENKYLDGMEIESLPKIIKDIYYEIQQSFKGHTPILSGMGLRSLLEAICLHQDVGGKTLQNKIDNLFDEGLIAKKEVSVLHDLRQIGNVTVHEIKAPKNTILQLSLEILNHTLRSLYTIPQLANKLKE